MANIDDTVTRRKLYNLGGFRVEELVLHPLTAAGATDTFTTQIQNPQFVLARTNLSPLSTRNCDKIVDIVSGRTLSVTIASIGDTGDPMTVLVFGY